MPGQLGDTTGSLCSGETRESCVAWVAECGADPLGSRTVDHDLAAAAVDDAELVSVLSRRRAARAHLAPETLNGHLEMHEGPFLSIGLRNQGRVRNHPFLCVRRDIWPGLVHLPEGQREGRGEEAGLLLNG